MCCRRSARLPFRQGKAASRTTGFGLHLPWGSLEEVLDAILDHPTSAKVPIIFAMPSNGSIDGRLEAAVKNIYERTDDCIYYGRILIDDVAKQGRNVRSQFSGKMRGRLPNIHAPIFSQAVQLVLMLAEDKYAEWNSAFIRRVPRTKRRWIGRVAYGVRSRWRQLLKSGRRAGLVTAMREMG